MKAATIELTVNHQPVTATCATNATLASLLRDNLGLTGTHIGCDTSQCGACVVHLNGASVKSCTVLAAQAAGSEVVTIEGIGSANKLHPMQESFRACHGLQCGFCTPGVIMSAIDMVNRNGTTDEASIRKGLEGSICRCTGYHNIVKSIQMGAEKMRSGEGV